MRIPGSIRRSTWAAFVVALAAAAPVYAQQSTTCVANATAVCQSALDTCTASTKNTATLALCQDEYSRCIANIARQCPVQPPSTGPSAQLSGSRTAGYCRAPAVRAETLASG